MPLAALAPIVAVAAAWIIYCEWDLYHSTCRHLPRWAWAALIVASVPLGGVLWLWLGRGDG